ncbi:hypothetical protein HK098_000499 [Nowakowskiella sp. JEL0407]|nr:hypothetical protein HK098_000499 [Nowakowskiella sp. JEL0407]
MTHKSQVTSLKLLILPRNEFVCTLLILIAKEPDIDVDKYLVITLVINAQISRTVRVIVDCRGRHGILSAALFLEVYNVAKTTR